MKKLFKKITAIVMAAAISVSAMVVSSVSASAVGVFDGAKKMEAMELYNYTFKMHEHIIYEIKVPKSGSLTFRSKDNVGGDYTLYNPQGDKIHNQWFSFRGEQNAEWKIDDLQAGTYYLDIYCGDYDGEKLIDFYYTFTPDNKPTLSFKMTLKKGDTLQLGALTTNYDGKVKWTSTKKSVATVSSTGKITAKKKGTTTIRAELDNGMYIQIKLTVKKK